MSGFAPAVPVTTPAEERNCTVNPPSRPGPGPRFSVERRVASASAGDEVVAAS
ncbi:hypothetical protein [Amycolatopsis nalaikhensis]|uniref:Uncharacterized protein n=1 Tax=Amycolatopsis nalaikhensis TaxID=715472 RepID=A0ABY8XUU1_9PSEU|nr:hypothetical protein [Amycolatopsis sp. 2-2]WIV59200.1 hypothetical protein QP939_11495 [Amycolatopsis sp. 2-2]